MALRGSGSKLMSVTVAATIAVVGVATIYLPFMIDKEKLRGLDEDHDRVRKDVDDYFKAQQQQQKKAAETAKQKPAGGGSMWKNLKKSNED